jgi:hypothetical protein
VNTTTKETTMATTTRPQSLTPAPATAPPSWAADLGHRQAELRDGRAMADGRDQRAEAHRRAVIEETGDDFLDRVVEAFRRRATEYQQAGGVVPLRPFRDVDTQRAGVKGEPDETAVTVVLDDAALRVRSVIRARGGTEWWHLVLAPDGTLLAERGGEHADATAFADAILRPWLEGVVA